MKLVLVTVILGSLVSFSHSGGTDRYGCHNNRKTGDYHCHNPKQQDSRVTPPISRNIKLEKTDKKQKAKG